MKKIFLTALIGLLSINSYSSNWHYLGKPSWDVYKIYVDKSSIVDNGIIAHVRYKILLTADIHGDPLTSKNEKMIDTTLINCKEKKYKLLSRVTLSPKNKLDWWGEGVSSWDKIDFLNGEEFGLDKIYKYVCR